MATIQERLNRMKQDGQTATVQQRLDQMKRDGQVVQEQKAPAVSPVQNTAAVKQGGGGSGSAAPSASTVTLRDSRQAVGVRPAFGGPSSKPANGRPTGPVAWRSQMTDPRAAMEQVLSSSAKRRTAQNIRAEMDGLDSAIGEMKKQRDVLKSQAGLVSGRGGQGAGDYWVQLNSQTQALEKQIAQLESDRSGLQGQWNRADQTEFDLKMIQDREYRAAVDKAMGADYGWDTVDSRKPVHRDVGYAMTYLQAKARGDERLAASAMERADMALDRMSESQRNRLAWYVGTGDYDGAADYLNRIMPELNQAEAKDVEQTLSDWAQEHPIQGAAVNMTSWPFNIPAYLSNAGQAIQNAVTGKEEQNPHLSANVGTRLGTGTNQGTQQAAREAATQAFGSETAGEVASFLVGTGLSIGQNVSQIAMLGPGSLAAMGFSAAGSATQDVLDRGGTPQQAFLVGTSAGAIEAITEKIPLDNLFRLAREGGGKGLKSAVIEALKEMGTEASEEMISEIANNLVDTAVMGESSEYQMYVRELQEAGLSKEEAERGAFQQFYITNVFMSGLGGAISGGVMGAGAMAFNKAGQYVAQLSGDTQNAQKTADAIDRAYQAMAEKGMFSPEAGQAVDAAQEARGQDSPLLPTGETLRDAREKGGFYLPTGREGVTFLPGGQGILVDADRLAQGNGISALSGGEDAVQAPQRAGEGQAESQQAAVGHGEDAGQVAAQAVEVTAQPSQDITPEGQHRKEIQQVVRALRESYARGDIDEAGFDGAMDLIMEQEGFEGMDMLMEPVRGQGGTINGSEAGQQLPGGREERALDQGAGGQDGGLAEGGSRRAADTGRKAVDRQNVGRDLRLQTVSARELGIASGTDAKSVRVLPESAWDSTLRDTARKVRRETGKGVRFVLGGIQVTGSDSAVHQVRGAYTQDGIIVQVDHMRVSPEQIADHEIFHDYAQQDPGLIRAMEDSIAERYGREELRGILAEYAKGLRGIVDVSENGTALEDDQALEDLKNEVFADAYAGINAFGADAGKYQGEVLDTLEQRGVSDAMPGREYAGAVEQRTGPPVEQFSYEGRTEDGIEVYETSEEIRRLPYRQRIDVFLDLMRNEYKGRTAKFTANDSEVYYARFSEKDLGKNIYGDKRSSAGGIKAKVNVGADGGVFELVENAQYVGSRAESGKRSRVHSGVVSWDYFVKTVQIDGQVYDLLANVRKKPGGEYVYSIQLNESTTKAPAPSLASSHSENGDAQNRMLTGASEKFGAPDASSHTHTTEVGADRQGPSDVSKPSIAQSEAAVKGGVVLTPVS